MIIQSSNKPIILEFTEEIEGSGIFETFRATLWDAEKKKIKTWNKDNSNKHDNIIELPLEQEETAEMEGQVELEVKWLNSDNKTEFSEIETILVKPQNDKNVLEV